VDVGVFLSFTPFLFLQQIFPGMSGIPFEGVLEIDPKRFGFVRSRTENLRRGPDDPFVPPALIEQYSLRPGSMLEGDLKEIRTKKGKSPEIDKIKSINGLPPERWRSAPDFIRLDAIAPGELIRLEGPESDLSMRVVDLFCPIGKGQRALIVSPPKAGKTMLLQHLAHAISINNPEIALMVLLIDERPEEVTEMRRSIRGEVFASSSDAHRGDHTRLAQLVLEYAKRKVEAGSDVVVLMDSLTRIGRAFNLHQRGSGRTLSGGVDARALEVPKRIFGAARNIEHGGSLTILATALIETNSRMDELIFQEFKGTGNMELVLSRELANQRIFPAINLAESGTRREELLFGEDALLHQSLRRSIARLSPMDAMLAVRKMLEKYPTNDHLLAKLQLN
jgi:transcription termination factor Rho